MLILLAILLACSDPTDSATPVPNCGTDTETTAETETTGTTSTPSDVDGDGYGSPTDCDDTSAAVHPGAAEVCDGIDQDCDGETDEGATDTAVFYLDGDADGFGAEPVQACALPDGASLVDGDCNDGDAAVSPSATEVCNQVDDDCDGSTDEGVTATAYRDGDGDGYGAGDALEVCALSAGETTLDGDCDDADPSSYPGADEAFDTVDNDCDGDATEGDPCSVPYGYLTTDPTGEQLVELGGLGAILSGTAYVCDWSCDAWWITAWLGTTSTCASTAALPDLIDDEDRGLCLDFAAAGEATGTCTLTTSAGDWTLTVEQQPNELVRITGL